MFAMLERVLCVFASGVGVAVPESVPRGSVDVLERGVGSITFVRFGRGELGRDGASWVGAGVDVASVDIFGWEEVKVDRRVGCEGGEEGIGHQERVAWLAG